MITKYKIIQYYKAIFRIGGALSFILCHSLSNRPYYKWKSFLVYPVGHAPPPTL